MSKGRRKTTLIKPITAPAAQPKVLSEEEQLATFAKRTQWITKMYESDVSTSAALRTTTGVTSSSYTDADSVWNDLSRVAGLMIQDGSQWDQLEGLIVASQTLYASNPIYASVINYYANLFNYRYKVIPHYTKRRFQSDGTIKPNKEKNFAETYDSIIQVVKSLSLSERIPTILTSLFRDGAVYLFCFLDKKTNTVATIVLPPTKCRIIGVTQYGTAIVQFDLKYFDDWNLSAAALKEFFKQFPPEFEKAYRQWKNATTNKTALEYMTLPSAYATGLTLNNLGVPSFFYTYGNIINYHTYQDNELERNTNLLKYLVIHEIPSYQDKVLLDNPDIAALHKEMKKIIDIGNRVRLITTPGTIHIEKVSDTATAVDHSLEDGFDSIYSSLGINSKLFSGETQYSLQYSIEHDKAFVWNFVKQIGTFYSMAINNLENFNSYEANIEFIRVSPYTYTEDIGVYRNNATTGVGKLDYLIASGMKQEEIQDQFDVENLLNLDSLKPLQMASTQSAGSNGTGDETDSPADRQRQAGTGGTTQETAQDDETSTSTSTASTVNGGNA